MARTSDAYREEADPHVNRITDTCENITLPHTLYAGGKHYLPLLVTRKHSSSVIILNTISKRQDGSDLFIELHASHFRSFADARKGR